MRSIVPKTNRADRLKENFAHFGFELTEFFLLISRLDRHRCFNELGDLAEAAFNTRFPIYG